MGFKKRPELRQTGATRCPDCFVRLPLTDDDDPDAVIATHCNTNCDRAVAKPRLEVKR